MQELEAENLEPVFVAFRDAPYLDYLLSCKIYVALEDEKLMGFIGFKPGKIEFIYVDPNAQGRGIATKLMEKTLDELKRPVSSWGVYQTIIVLKALYKKSLVLKLLKR